MEWVHLVHVIGSMIWVGGVLPLGAIGPIVLGPGPILVLAAGIWSLAESEGPASPFLLSGGSTPSQPAPEGLLQRATKTVPASCLTAGSGEAS